MQDNEGQDPGPGSACSGRVSSGLDSLKVGPLDRQASDHWGRGMSPSYSLAPAESQRHGAAMAAATVAAATAAAVVATTANRTMLECGVDRPARAQSNPSGSRRQHAALHRPVRHAGQLSEEATEQGTYPRQTTQGDRRGHPPRYILLACPRLLECDERGTRGLAPPVGRTRSRRTSGRC